MTRVTLAELEDTTTALTEELRTAGIIAPDARAVIYRAYGGTAFHVTGGEHGTGHATGVAGLASNVLPARQALTIARAVIDALQAARNAR